MIPNDDLFNEYDVLSGDGTAGGRQTGAAEVPIPDFAEECESPILSHEEEQEQV